MYNYLFKSHQDVTKEVIYKSYNFANINADLKISDSLLTGKIVEYTGNITSISKDDLMLDNIVFCQFIDTFLVPVKVNQVIKIKGRVIGYDDLFNELKLDQCYFLD
jgi:hypothetical protein